MTSQAGDVSQVSESLLCGAAAGASDGSALGTGDHVCSVFGVVTALHDGDGYDEVLEIDEGELAVD